MALYQAPGGAHYLCTFRSSQAIISEVVGGLFAFDRSNARPLGVVADRVSILSLVNSAAFITLVLLQQETQDGDRILALYGIMGFLPFAALLIAIILLSSAPTSVRLKNTRLEISDLEISIRFHRALTLSGLSIFFLFAYLALLLKIDDADDSNAFIGLTVFWLVYTALRFVGLYNLERHKISS